MPPKIQQFQILFRPYDLLDKLRAALPYYVRCLQRARTDVWPSHAKRSPQILFSPVVIKTLEQLLSANILPFWTRHCADAIGYRLNHDTKGCWLGPAPKGIVGQSRMVWFFSRLARTRYGRPEHLDMARRGFELLEERLLDATHGGFFWELGLDGKVTKPHKHLYGQSFALYALSAYARASGDAAATRRACDLFERIDTHLKDPLETGWFDFRTQDWREPSTATANYLRGTSTGKTMDAHLHLMEALIEFAGIDPRPLVRHRLNELIELFLTRFFSKKNSGCLDLFTRTWQPVPEPMPISYGHQLEAIWLLDRAAAVTGYDPALLIIFFKTLFDTTMRHGFDSRLGGFYYRGFPGSKASDRRKNWWTQAEGLVGSLTMFRLFQRTKHAEAFLKTLDWIFGYQADWRHGDWHRDLRRLRPVGFKAYNFKTAYHNGRAMLECLEMIDAMQRESPPPA